MTSNVPSKNMIFNRPLCFTVFCDRIRPTIQILYPDMSPVNVARKMIELYRSMKTVDDIRRLSPLLKPSKSRKPYTPIQKPPAPSVSSINRSVLFKKSGKPHLNILRAAYIFSTTKRPRSPYILWTMYRRANIGTQLSSKDFIKKVSQEWRLMNEKDKAVFVKSSNEEKVKYKWRKIYEEKVNNMSKTQRFIEDKIVEKIKNKHRCAGMCKGGSGEYVG